MWLFHWHMVHLPRVWKNREITKNHQKWGNHRVPCEWESFGENLWGGCTAAKPLYYRVDPLPMHTLVTALFKFKLSFSPGPLKWWRSLNIIALVSLNSHWCFYRYPARYRSYMIKLFKMHFAWFAWNKLQCSQTWVRNLQHVRNKKIFPKQ